MRVLHCFFKQFLSVHNCASVYSFGTLPAGIPSSRYNYSLGQVQVHCYCPSLLCMLLILQQQTMSYMFSVYQARLCTSVCKQVPVHFKSLPKDHKWCEIIGALKMHVKYHNPIDWVRSSWIEKYLALGQDPQTLLCSVHMSGPWAKHFQFGPPIQLISPSVILREPYCFFFLQVVCWASMPYDILAWQNFTNPFNKEKLQQTACKRKKFTFLLISCDQSPTISCP